MRVDADLFAFGATIPVVVGSWGLAGGLRRLSDRRAQLVRSFAGGVGLSFVILDLFVELAATGEGPVHDVLRVGPQPIHTIAFLLLAGTVVWFVANTVGARFSETWTSYLVAVAPRLAYGAFVGAALLEEEHEGEWPYLLFGVAVILHLAVSEYRLCAAFPREHHGILRAIVMLTPLIGGLAWVAIEAHEGMFHAVLAIVAGATLLSIFREEMPSPGATRVGALIAGVIVFGALVQLRWWQH